ncbi:hypothetical protein VKT23_004282 [Stygiomarasmius scandens]|uniref:Mediator of RNA polymerase II transcription subunit 16 n=1 Tax=Marasmiellus scandens TaxID=2682957 RepID=A0ABR1JZH1_9AGAR
MLPSVGTPSKSKVNENWSSGWWDFYPLIEQPRPPVEWSNSSVIFTAHAAQPLVVARHFSSSKQFTLHSPNPINSKPASYHPPSIITASPDDQWLFAFFPGKDMDGVSCLWKRGFEVDNWAVQEFWTYSAQAGVVSADWLGVPREWNPHPVTGIPIRNPHRGPKTPASNPNLVLVTQDHCLTLCYLRHYSPTLKMLRCSLLNSNDAAENVPRQFTDSQTDAGSIRICINACVGIPYNDSSLVVATRSQTFPLQVLPSNHSQFSSMDLSMPLEPEVQSDPLLDIREECIEESGIELCEVQLKFDGAVMRLSAEPMTSIQDNSERLKDMHFVHNAASPKSTPSMYMVASFLDFDDYSSLPKSSLKSYSFSKDAAPGKKSWKWRHESTRSFDNRVVGFIVPSKQVGSHPGLLAGLYDTSGSHKRKARQFSIGGTRRLKVPDLQDDEQWNHPALTFPGLRGGRDLPTNVSLSPNDALFCTISSSLWTSQTSIHRAPEYLGHPTPTDGVVSSFISSKLAAAVVSRCSTGDLTHILSMQTFPSNEVVDIMYNTFSILDRCEGVPWIAQIGLCLEVYRSRAHHTKSELERKRYTDKWQTLHDICSVAACNAIFEECKLRIENIMDIEIVWQLIDLSGWIVTLLERLMKECVLSFDFGAGHDTKAKPLDASIFLHLTHPIALRTLRTTVNSMKRFRQIIDGLTPKSENTQIAKDALVDIIDYAGVDVSGLEEILDKFSQAMNDIDERDVRRGLAACQPTPAMQSRLQGLVKTISESHILHKARLFIKPYELVDGVPQPLNKKEKTRDVVLKGILLYRTAGMKCLRCGGKSELGKESRPRVWDKMWNRRCICAGEWGINTT